MRRRTGRIPRSALRMPAAHAIAPGLEAVEERILLSSIVFDPDGSGPDPAMTIGALDWAPANALLLNGTNLTVGKAVDVLIQQNLAGVIDPNSNETKPAGLGTTFEITSVARVSLIVSSINNNNSFITFSLNPVQGPNTFFEMWFDPAANADPLAGTGYNDGTRIFLGKPDPALAGLGNVSLLLDMSGNLIHEPFDMFGPDNYPGISTVVAPGSLLLGADVTSFDPTFFMSPLTDLVYNSSLVAPFNETNPSAQFVGLPGGVAPNVIPNIGTINGENGAELQVQVDGNFSFGSGTSAIAVAKQTNGQTAPTPPGPIVAAGSTVTFTYQVTNPGTVPLHNVTVTDDNGTPNNPADDFHPTFTGGDTNGDGQLDPGETWSYTASAAAIAGQYENIVTAQGVDTGGNTVTNTAVSHYFGVTTGLGIQKLTNGQSAPNPPGPIVAVGSTVTWTYTVSTAGNSPLSNVVVTDDNGTPGNPADDFHPTFVTGDANNNGKLDPGETWVYTANAPATAGQYTNTATVTGVNVLGNTEQAQAVSHYFGASPAIAITKTTNGQSAPNPPGPSVAVGSTVTFDYAVTNPGNVPLSNVVVTDDNGTPNNPADDFHPTFTGGDTNNNGQLDPGETWTYTATATAIAGQYTNTVTTTGTPPVGPNVTAQAVSHYFGVSSAITFTKLVNGQSAPNPTGPVVLVGSTVTFTYQLSNTGNDSLSNVVLTDNNGTPNNPADDFHPTFTGGDTNNNGKLDPGETWDFAATRTATPGQYTNVAVATATNTLGSSLQAQATGNVFGASPAIAITKTTNGQSAPNPPGPSVAVGSTVTFDYAVTNPGNVPLSNVVVTDDNGTPNNPADDFHPTFTGGDTNNNGQLDPGETWTYSATATAIAGQYTNTVTTTGTPPVGPNVTAQAVSHYFGVSSAITLTKLTNGQNAPNPTGPVVLVGSTVTFTYDLTNTGNDSLSNVVLTDDNGTPNNTADDFHPTFIGGDANNNGKLDPGETWVYSATKAATPGQYTNVAVATGTNTLGNTLQAQATSHFFGASPVIAITKQTNGQSAPNPPGPNVAVGSTVTFTYAVTNPGNVALSNVTVTDDNGTPNNPADDFHPTFTGGDTNNNGKLDPGETWTYSATAKAIAGQYTNMVTTTGTPPTGPNVTAQAVSHYFAVTSGLNVVKLTNGQNAPTAPGPIVPVGSTVTFTYTVSNTGNSPITGLVLTDDNGTPNNPADDFHPTFVSGDINNNGILDPGETWIFTANRVATPGQYENFATATGTNPLGTPVQGQTVSHFFGAAPAIAVTKVTNVTMVAPTVDVFRRLGFHAQPTRFVVTFNQPMDVASVENINNYMLISAGRDHVLGTADDQFIPLKSAVYDPTTRTVTLTPAQRILPLRQLYQITINGTPPSGLMSQAGQFLSGGNFVRSFGPEALSLFPGHNVVPSTPNQVPANAQGPITQVGSPVTWNYTVTNPGNQPLSNVVVTDDNGTPGNPADDFHPTFTGGDTNGNGLLDSGETWTFTATQAAQMGQYTNNVTAVGQNPQGQPVMATAQSHYFGVCPVVEDFVRNGVHHNIAQIVLTYNGPIDQAQAQNLANYQLISAGRDGVFGTPDDRVIPLASAVYDPVAHTVTLTPTQQINVHGLYQITAQNPCMPGHPFVGVLNRKFSLGSIFPATPTTTTTQTRIASVPRGPQHLARQIPAHTLTIARKMPTRHPRLFARA